MTTNIHHRSDRQDWATPQWLVDALPYKFIWDVCATRNTSKTGANYFGPDHERKIYRDGLAYPWNIPGGDYFWMNPPYGTAIGHWMKKAHQEMETGGTTVVCLVPARTDTRWWHDYAMGAWKIHLIKGRITFEGAPHPAPFPSALVVFNLARASKSPIRTVYGTRTAPLFECLDLKVLRSQYDDSR